MSHYQSEAVSIRGAVETTRGAQPTAGWQRLEVDVGGVQGFQRTYQDVERDIHSVNATLEKGDHVAYTVEPQLVHDPNKDFLDLVLPAIYRCVPKHLGGTGASKFYPSAVADGGSDEDSFTVAANGAIPDGMLIYARGFTNAQNNSVFVTSGTSTSTAIKVPTATLAAETPPAGATVEVIGFQGTSGDLEIDANGNLKSTTLDFRTLGLVVGMQITLPTAAEATAMGNAAYAFASNAGQAYIKSIDEHLVELEKHTWTPQADAGASKTVRVFVQARFYRTWAMNDATNYAEPTLTFEKEDIKPVVAADTRYTYVHGCGAQTFTLASPLNSKITATLAMVGMTATTPLAPANRKGGAGSVPGDSPAKAYEPQVTALVDAQNDLQYVRLGDSNGVMLAKFSDWTYTHGNNIAAQGVEGVFGVDDLNYGKFNDQVSFTGYYGDSDVIDAVDENRDGCWFDVSVRNHQFGWTLHMPNVGIRNAVTNYAGNQPVMLSGDLIGFRDANTGIQVSFGVYAWLPTA